MVGFDHNWTTLTEEQRDEGNAVARILANFTNHVNTDPIGPLRCLHLFFSGLSFEEKKKIVFSPLDWYVETYRRYDPNTRNFPADVMSGMWEDCDVTVMSL